MVFVSSCVRLTTGRFDPLPPPNIQKNFRRTTATYPHTSARLVNFSFVADKVFEVFQREGSWFGVLNPDPLNHGFSEEADRCRKSRLQPS